MIKQAARHLYEKTTKEPLLTWCEALWTAAIKGSCGVTIEQFTARPNPDDPINSGVVQICTMDSSEPSPFGWWCGVIMPSAAEASQLLCLELAELAEPPAPRVITATEACRSYNVTKSTIQRHLKKGCLIDLRQPGSSRGNPIMLDESEVRKLYTSRDVVR